MDDPYDLARFVAAQEAGSPSAYDRALGELRAGRKETHWIWYVFPQLRGLGRSETAHRFGIASLEEAAAYAGHDRLGPRLREATEAVLTHGGLAHEEKSANAIFGSPDDLKFRSSMTLFERAARDGALFGRALEAFYGGERDEETLKRL
jgi:uncharacterized protein (DUF1810 family)